MTRLTKTESLLVAGFLSLASFPLLFIFRSYDNNTLVSWKWVFTDQNIDKVLLFLVLAVIVSLLISCTAPIEKYPVATLTAFSLLAGVLTWNGPELLLDSGRVFLEAKYLSEYGILSFLRQWGNSILVWTDTPLVPIIYGILFKVFNESRLAVQLFNTIIFAATVVLTSLLGKLLLGKETGVYAGLFLLGTPYLFTQVPLLLVDIHTMFFFTFAVYAFIKALSDRGWGWAGIAAPAIVFAMLAKYSTWPMLLLLPLIAAGSLQSNPAKVITRTLVIFSLAALLASLIIVQNYTLFLAQIGLLMNYQAPALQQWREHLFSTFFFQIHPWISILALWAIVNAFRQKNTRLLFIGVFVLLFVCQFKRIRYILPLLPLITLIAAHGLNSLREKESKRFIGLVTVTFSMVILHTAYRPFFNQTSMTNIMDAGAYVNTLPQDAIEVYALPQEHSEAKTVIAVPQLDLFTSKNIVVRQKWLPLEVRKNYHPLLFTWHLDKPPYYQDGRDTDFLPLVVISGSPIADEYINEIHPLTVGRTVKRFNRHSTMFRYKTFVSVYH